MKVCTKCKAERPFSDFAKLGSSKDGFQYRCKPCAKDYYQENRERELTRSKLWAKSNRDRCYENKKKWKKNNKEHIKNYYQENKDRELVRAKKWKEDNRERVKEYSRNWQKSRRESDPLFKLRSNLRNRTFKAFTKDGWSKKSKTKEVLGAEWLVVKAHIESRFNGGMSWDNYGEWHIDHIIPLASAKTVEELIELCHYTNLQPLWAEENISKGDKIIACRINLNQ